MVNKNNDTSRERLELDGTIMYAHGNGMFIVNIAENYNVMCTLSGKMRTNSIKVLEGDMVRIEVSPYDTTKGRITFRVK